ncbi:MAG: hypothetical protein MUF84_05970 [Anaerolineae bacterium]|jgi:CheY-like chemotaxis protein|nr:hypothetical protein [Anaerolineae bacterium]
MRVLVVDPNVGFAALLEVELERLGHEVVVCSEGYGAYQAARISAPALALLDVGLQDPDALSLARSLRLLGPEMRLMLVVAAGEDAELGDPSVSIQGVLPRPFFLPELPERIEAVMATPVEQIPAMSSGSPGVTDERDVQPLDHVARDEDAGQGGSPPGESQSGDPGDSREARQVAEARGLSRRAFRLHQGAIESLMAELGRDVGAAGVLLTTMNSLLTVVGTLDEAEIDAISRAVLQGRQTSAEVAHILGLEQVRFEQSTAGDSHMLYALGVHDATLALMVRGEAQLGLLRHRARNAAERIAALCVPGE